MWLPGAQLSVRYRAFQLAEPSSEVATTGRRLAQELLESRGARLPRERCIAFIRELKEFSTDLEGILTWQSEGDLLSLLNIPTPYGVKGGAAREILAQLLKIRATRECRDIDLVRRGAHAVPDDESIAQAWMGRDYLLGARVELVRSVERHLTSRDLTVNEVVVFDDRAHASLLAVLDTVGHVLRPSRYRGGTLHRPPSLHGQSLLKMVRLFAEGENSGEAWSILGIPDTVSFSDFDLAVHLNKAFQRGQGVAERFLVTCEQLGLISTSVDPLMTALNELEYLRHGEKGVLPDVPRELWLAAGVEGDGPQTW